MSDNGYYISFAGSFEDSLGNLPIQKNGVLSSPEYVEFAVDGYLTHNIANLLEDKDKITIELDYMFLAYTQPLVIIPVFTTDKTIFPHKLPMTIWSSYATGNGMYYNVFYSCGVPEDRNGYGMYTKMIVNKWYHSKLTWIYSKQTGYYWLDDSVMSLRWPSTTRNYNIRLTKLYFGMINEPVYDDFDNAIYSKANIKIKNFKMTFE